MQPHDPLGLINAIHSQYILSGNPPPNLFLPIVNQVPDHQFQQWEDIHEPAPVLAPALENEYLEPIDNDSNILTLEDSSFLVNTNSFNLDPQMNPLQNNSVSINSECYIPNSEIPSVDQNLFVSHFLSIIDPASSQMDLYSPIREVPLPVIDFGASSSRPSDVERPLEDEPEFQISVGFTHQQPLDISQMTYFSNPFMPPFEGYQSCTNPGHAYELPLPGAEDNEGMPRSDEVLEGSEDWMSDFDDD